MNKEEIINLNLKKLIDFKVHNLKKDITIADHEKKMNEKKEEVVEKYQKFNLVSKEKEILKSSKPVKNVTLLDEAEEKPVLTYEQEELLFYCNKEKVFKELKEKFFSDNSKKTPKKDHMKRKVKYKKGDDEFNDKENVYPPSTLDKIQKDRVCNLITTKTSVISRECNLITTKSSDVSKKSYNSKYSYKVKDVENIEAIKKNMSKMKVLKVRNI